MLHQTDDPSGLPEDAGTAIDGIVETIRRRVGHALEDAEADTDVAVASLRSIYREIKTQQIVPAADVICRKNLATT